MTTNPLDTAARTGLFRWLEQQVATQGDVLPWRVLRRGFVLDGKPMPAISPAGRGIWKPKGLSTALSIVTGPGSPYNDHFDGDSLAYSYQGTNPDASDNRAVRNAIQPRTPLAYFHAVESGWYFAAWPVFIVGDEPEQLRFWVQAEPHGVSIGGQAFAASMEGSVIESQEPRRAYGTSQVKIRIHQRGFRERVLAAYKDRCAVCDLKHRELLDAAHIIPDSEGGEPVVRNGLALCKIHHAAFDSRVIGVHPDSLRVAVRTDVLEEVDGPMLLHGIQEMADRKIWVPRSAEKRPDRDALAVQWERFLDVG